MMKRMTRWLTSFGAIALALALGFVFVACGGSDNSSSRANADSDQAAHVEEDTTSDEALHVDLPVDEGNGGTEQSVLHVTLTEWSVTGHDGAAQFTAPAGETTFEVHNEGASVHELVIIKTDTDPAALPVGGGRVDEGAAGHEIGEVEEFPAGEMAVGTFTLEPGKYALICNIPGHYQQGMYAQLVVQ